MDSTVLVTGGGGFVGAAVVRRLAAALSVAPLPLSGGGHVQRVAAVLRPGGSRARLEELVPGPAWTVVEADLTNSDAVAAMLDRVRPVAVIHTALDRTVYHEASPDLLENRVAAPLASLVRGLARAQGTRFVHAGSAWVLPGGEALREDIPPAPASTYGRAKALEDRLLPELAGSAGIEWINLRLFNLFGRYERPDRLIPYLVRRLGSGQPAELSVPENVRDFTDVDLVSRAFILALGSPSAAADRLYHIGTGRGTTIARMAGLVAEVLGGADLVRFERTGTPDADMKIQVADIDRARTGLGWDPPDDLPARVRSAVVWWSRRLSSGGDRMKPIRRSVS